MDGDGLYKEKRYQKLKEGINTELELSNIQQMLLFRLVNRQQTDG